jgi:hypothetical protein
MHRVTGHVSWKLAKLFSRMNKYLVRPNNTAYSRFSICTRFNLMLHAYPHWCIFCANKYYTICNLISQALTKAVNNNIPLQCENYFATSCNTFAPTCQANPQNQNYLHHCAVRFDTYTIRPQKRNSKTHNPKAIRACVINKVCA